MLCTDSSAALGFVKRKHASRPTRYVDTKVYFVQAWAMEPGQRILKVHGDSQQVADLIAEAWDFDRCSNLSNIDEGVRKIAAHHFFCEERLKVRQKCLSQCRLTENPHAANPAWRWSASTSQERGVSPSDTCAHLRPRRHVATAFAAAQERMAPHLILQACSALLCKRRGSRRAFAFAN